MASPSINNYLIDNESCVIGGRADVTLLHGLPKHEWYSVIAKGCQSGFDIFTRERGRCKTRKTPGAISEMKLQSDVQLRS